MHASSSHTPPEPAHSLSTKEAVGRAWWCHQLAPIACPCSCTEASAIHKSLFVLLILFGGTCYQALQLDPMTLAHLHLLQWFQPQSEYLSYAACSESFVASPISSWPHGLQSLQLLTPDPRELGWHKLVDLIKQDLPLMVPSGHDSALSTKKAHACHIFRDAKYSSSHWLLGIRSFGLICPWWCLHWWWQPGSICWCLSLILFLLLFVQSHSCLPYLTLFLILAGQLLLCQDFFSGSSFLSMLWMQVSQSCC